mmetsp:Transcript_94226/g.269841  ORF Transcript_94226/g.269841 Transcript_94226/m.269841 type:complete len:215 (+) Transcript_94226:28-672(+)
MAEKEKEHHELNSLVRHTTHRDLTELHSPSPDGLSSTSAPSSASTTTSAADSAAADDLWSMAARRALGGGLGGALAMAIQVTTLMPFHTVMNHQYRHGGTMVDTTTALWREGGLARLYRGLQFSLMMGPLCRFGDTAANTGVLFYLESNEQTRTLPIVVKSGIGSVAATSWRIFLAPLDTAKTFLQVEGPNAFPMLVSKVRDLKSAPMSHPRLR